LGPKRVVGKPGIGPLLPACDVDDFVAAKASKNLADRQISIEADHPDFTVENTRSLPGF
jgi:hypothetical protein